MLLGPLSLLPPGLPFPDIHFVSIVCLLRITHRLFTAEAEDRTLLIAKGFLAPLPQTSLLAEFLLVPAFLLRVTEGGELL